MIFRAVIFDLDGTLLHTLEDLGDSLNAALAEKGLPLHSYDEYQAMIGNGQKMLVHRALPEDWRDPERAGPVSSRFTEIYQANQCRKTRPYPGVMELLKDLKGRGFRLAVLSNKNQANAAAVVEHYFPGLFEAVRGLRPEWPAKPDPASAMALVGEMGLAPEHFLYLGDSGVDMRTARRAGLRAVGATWGYRRREELEAAGAEAVIDAPAELLDLIDKLAV